MHYRVRQGSTAEEAACVQRVHQHLSRREIQITKGEYNKQPWVKIFSCIEYSNARKLSTFANEAPIELKFILRPHFPHLKELILSCNKIVSIESIARLDAPQLEDINLLTNLITSVRSLRKAHFPQLKELNISNNPIQDPTFLAQLASKQLTELHVERWTNLPMIGESKRWALKLSPASEQLKALTLKSKQRRQEIDIDKMIEAKYPAFKDN